MIGQCDMVRLSSGRTPAELRHAGILYAVWLHGWQVITCMSSEAVVSGSVNPFHETMHLEENLLKAYRTRYPRSTVTPVTYTAELTTTDDLYER